MSIPGSCQTGTTPHAAAGPGVAVNAVAAAVLAAVIASAEVVRVPGFQARPQGDGASARPH